MNDSILVFIPMYNCEKQIGRVLSKLEAHQEIFAEVLVVDNRSVDDSINKAIEGLKKLTNIKTTLIQNNENYSLGGSHKVAFNYCIEKCYSHCIILHGDDQCDINDIIPYLSSGEHRQYEALLGSRFDKHSKIIGKYPIIRILGNKILNLLCSIATFKWITEMGSGINMYKTDIFHNKFYLHFPNDLTFNVFLLFHHIYTKINFKYFPIQFHEYDQVSNAKVFKQGMIILDLITKYLLNRKNLFIKLDNKYSIKEYSYKIIYSHKTAYEIVAS